MQLVRWADVPPEKISPTVERQVVWGEKATLARFFFAKGTHVTLHRHQSEQHTCVLQGAMKLKLGPIEVVVSSGEALLVPAGVEHEVWVLEDTVVLDFFAPAREDWRAGAHQYLQG